VQYVLDRRRRAVFCQCPNGSDAVGWPAGVRSSRIRQPCREFLLHGGSSFMFYSSAAFVHHGSESIRAQWIDWMLQSFGRHSRSVHSVTIPSGQHDLMVYWRPRCTSRFRFRLKTTFESSFPIHGSIVKGWWGDARLGSPTRVRSRGPARREDSHGFDFYVIFFAVNAKSA